MTSEHSDISQEISSCRSRSISQHSGDQPYPINFETIEFSSDSDSMSDMSRFSSQVESESSGRDDQITHLLQETSELRQQIQNRLNEYRSETQNYVVASQKLTEDLSRMKEINMDAQQAMTDSRNSGIQFEYSPIGNNKSYLDQQLYDQIVELQQEIYEMRDKIKNGENTVRDKERENQELKVLLEWLTTRKETLQDSNKNSSCFSKCCII